MDDRQLCELHEQERWERDQQLLKQDEPAYLNWLLTELEQERGHQHDDIRRTRTEQL